nr:MAG TPA: hypothetical protein [Caudoviricetes sp.]
MFNFIYILCKPFFFFQLNHSFTYLDNGTGFLS